jgi:hypothetical protein
MPPPMPRQTPEQNVLLRVERKKLHAELLASGSIRCEFAEVDEWRLKVAKPRPRLRAQAFGD